MVDALLNAATFSKSYDGSEKGMSFEDFRSWCKLVPTIRKFFGSLLMPPGQETLVCLRRCCSSKTEKVVCMEDTPQPWERHSDFYGDMKSYLFQLNPKASIFRPTGANTNIQWCATNFTSENIPNGIGFGGKINHFGLFVSASFDQGQTFTCTTFGSQSLSKTNRIQPEVIECWGIVQASDEQDTQHNAIKGTVLDRFKEDRNMLKQVGMAGNSND